MLAFKLVMLAAVWLGVILCLATGYLHAPNYRVRRRDRPQEFWVAWSASTALALVASYLIWNLLG